MKPSQKHADKIFYEMAGSEIESGQIDKGLMVKAISKSGGDKKKAELIYLDWRIELLKEQAVEDAERQEMERVQEKARVEKEAQIKKEKDHEEYLKRREREERESNRKYKEEQRKLPFYKKDIFYIVYVLLGFGLVGLIAVIF